MKRVTVSSDDDPFMKAFSGASPPASGTPSNAQSTAQTANSGKSTFGSSFFKNAFNKKATPTNQSTNAPSPTVPAPTTPSNSLSNGQSSESEDINPDLDRERRRKAAAVSATPTNQSTSQTVSHPPEIVRSQSLNQPVNHVLFGLQPAVIPELGPPVNPLLPYQDFTQVDDNVMLDHLDDWDSHGEIAGEKPVMEIPNVFYYRDAESINQNTQQAYAHSITRNASGQSAPNQTSGASGGSYQPPSTVFHEDKSTVLGKLYMTNYQLYLEPLIDRKERAAKIVLEGVIAVPLATIERVEHEKPKGHLKILDCHCKDGRVLRFGFLEPEQARKAYDCLITYVFPSKDDYLFCFYHKPRMPIPVHLNGWNLYNPIVEFKRMGIPNHGIRLTKANMKYQLSTSYPALLAVPNEKYFSDAELEAVAVFRSRGRVPACTWQHPHGRQTIWRSSQPRVGMNNARSMEDEKMLYAISAATGVKDIAIFDCRPKMNAQANRLAGKGFESAENYRNCRIYFMDIENIHAMRASYQALIKACSSDSHSVGFQQALNASKWLSHVAGVLKATFQMVMAIDRDKLSVLSHCSDGWDRTSQLVTLTELCLDPYYRTLEGFCVLVEKDWLSFGHQFAKRTGHRENKSTDEQRSPIMLQWLDCVFQLTQQFPRHFEFNSHFLVTLQSHLYSCRFGTFLFNTEYMRKKTKLHTNTVSLWTYFMCSPAACRGEFTNPLYAPNGTGSGVASADLGLWKKESHVIDCINKRVNAGEPVLVNANAAGMTSVTAGPADSVSIPVPVPDVAASDSSDASSTEVAVSSENAESSDTHEVSKATDDSVAETSTEEATSNGDAHPLHAKPSTSSAPSVPSTQATAAPTTSNTPVPTARRASTRVDEDLPEPRKSSVGRGGGDGTAKDYTGAVLYPSWSLKKVTLWSDYYLRWHSDQAEHGSSMGPIGPGSVPPGGAATTHFLSVDSILSRSIRQHAELANELEDEVAALKQKLIDAGLSPDVTITPAITHDPSARRNKLRPARPVYDVTRYENVLNEDEDLSNIQEQDEPDDVEDAQM